MYSCQALGHVSCTRLPRDWFRTGRVLGDDGTGPGAPTCTMGPQRRDGNDVIRIGQGSRDGSQDGIGAERRRGRGKAQEGAGWIGMDWSR